MAAKVEPGTHQTTTTAATLYEAPSGALMCFIQAEIGLKGGICLVQKDGTLSERGFKDAQSIFGLTGWDWALWEREPEAWAGHAVEFVVETLEGDRGEFSSVKYVNVPGGGQQMEKADATALATKYAAKTRALLGGKQSKPKPPKKPPVQAELPTAEASTMEAVWAKWCEGKDDSLAEEELYKQWDAAVQASTNKEQNDCTPEDWGVMLAKLSDQIPM